jgi:hypothetical protein
MLVVIGWTAPASLMIRFSIRKMSSRASELKRRKSSSPLGFTLYGASRGGTICSKSL